MPSSLTGGTVPSPLSTLQVPKYFSMSRRPFWVTRYQSNRKHANMMTLSNGNIFRVTGPLWGESVPHKGQWRGALMFSLICDWTNVWANNGDTDDLGRHRAHHDVIVMKSFKYILIISTVSAHGPAPLGYASVLLDCHISRSWWRNTFCITDPLWGESTGERCFPLTKG